MSNLRELPLHELGRGLMRGDRVDLKLGYTAATRAPNRAPLAKGP
jgi:hypothetical protein